MRLEIQLNTKLSYVIRVAVRLVNFISGWKHENELATRSDLFRIRLEKQK